MMMMMVVIMMIPNNSNHKYHDKNNIMRILNSTQLKTNEKMNYSNNKAVCVCVCVSKNKHKNGSLDFISYDQIADNHRQIISYIYFWYDAQNKISIFTFDI